MSNQQQQQHYRRSYKACLACRQRKSRCELADEWQPGQPCKRCHRQRKSCVFPPERVAEKDSNNLKNSGEPQPGGPLVTTTQTAAQGHGSDGPSPQLSTPRSRVRQTQKSPWNHGDADVSNPVMRTMISSNNDALEVLFDPVRHGNQHEPFANANPGVSQRLQGPDPRSSVLDIWNACRFVKQGWFLAEEAIFLMDMFFTNLQKLSPVLGDRYADHENHYELISSEPLLCCTILAISSSHHALPRAGGQLRGFFIHERLWTHVQHLILRVLLGQEKNSKGKIRTWGTIEALLLLTDWHPRALAFPPPIDGWDSDLLVHWTADCNDTPLQEANEARERWLEDIINPAKRTSHMSWMLTNCAVSLGVELGAFSEQNSSRYPPLDDVDSYRQDHIRKLLGLYAEQVALQHGRQSLLPQAAAHQIFRDSLNVRHERKDLSWFVDAWLNLTKLTRMVMETLYASGHQTSQLLHTGRYASLVEHFQPMLSSWRDRYLDKDRLPEFPYHGQLLLVEYNSAKLYALSLCIQAIIDRRGAVNGFTTDFTNLAGYGADDLHAINDVVDSATEVLTTAVHLADAKVLGNSPARMTFRVISASIFLLKSLGLGVGAAKLQTSLETIQRVITALRNSAIDEMSLGARYASLLEMHLSRLQNSFVTSTAPHGLEAQMGAGFGGDSQAESGTFQYFGNTQEGWFSLPFDETLVSTDFVDLQGFSNFDDNDLNFLWNLNYAQSNTGAV